MVFYSYLVVRPNDVEQSSIINISLSIFSGISKYITTFFQIKFFQVFVQHITFDSVNSVSLYSICTSNKYVAFPKSLILYFSSDNFIPF